MFSACYSVHELTSWINQHTLDVNMRTFLLALCITYTLVMIGSLPAGTSSSLTFPSAFIWSHFPTSTMQNAMFPRSLKTWKSHGSRESWKVMGFCCVWWNYLLISLCINRKFSCRHNAALIDTWQRFVYLHLLNLRLTATFKLYSIFEIEQLGNLGC